MKKKSVLESLRIHDYDLELKCVVGIFCVLLGCLLRYYYCTELGCLLQY